MSQSIKQVARGDIERGRNIRHQIRKARCQELYLSMKAHGILVPLLLEPGENLPYSIVDGLHRYLMAEELKLDYLPAIALPSALTDAERTERQLVINSQRSDLTPMEKAEAIDALMKATGLNASGAAERIGSTAPTVSKLLSLLRLPIDVQEQVSSGQLAFSHAYAISQEEDPNRQRALAAEAVEGDLTRDQVTRRTRQSSEPKSTPAKKAASRITLQLPGTQRLTFFGKTESLDAFAEILAAVVAKARKSARGGCDLPGFVALVNAETRAHA